MKCDPVAIKNFLFWWESNAKIWSITSIRTDQKGTITRCFEPKDIEGMLGWIISENETDRRNIYFTLNGLHGRVTVKPSREDIKELRWLHVDVDPRKGEDLAKEQERIRLLLSADHPANLPSPSLVTFSGGGYQAFWRLKEPVKVKDVDHAEELKLYNLHIENILGGDSCHNIDRLMRLPGTINWLNKKKVEAGRAPCLAAVVLQRDTAYALEEFTAAPPFHVLNPYKGKPPIGHRLELPHNLSEVPRLKSIDELPKEVNDYCKVIIVQGTDPDNPQRWGGDRSDALWYVVCELVRSGVTDLMIYSVITDKGFQISAHVLDQKNPSRYALRTIERAREMAVDPNLMRLNEKHAVIADIGGKCRVITEVYDHSLNRMRISRQTFEDFANRYANESVDITTAKGNVRPVPMGKWWLYHPQRRQYETMVFAPGEEISGAYNLWRGFAVEPKAGSCALFLTHMKEILCCGVAENYQYLLNWMANVVQHPGTPGQIAVVLKGRMGTGKSFFARYFGAVFGRHYLAVSDSKHLVGSFNAHLRDCILLFADEAFYAGDKKHEAILKTLITEDTLTIESKGFDVEMQRNCVHLIMASNELWAVPADLGDRRFFVLDVSEDKMQNATYFDALQAEFEGGGPAALLDYLQHIDLKEFELRQRPKTIGLALEKLMSLSPDQDWWYYCLREGKILETDENWPRFVITSAMMSSNLSYTRAWRTSMRSSATKLGMFLKSVIPGGIIHTRLKGVQGYRDHNGHDVTCAMPYAYVLPTLKECRAFWELKYGLLEPWPMESQNEGIAV